MLAVSAGDSVGEVWKFFQSGGLFMGLIVVCSLLAVSVIIYKIIDLRRSAILPDELVESLGHPQAAMGQLRSDEAAVGSPLGRITRAALAGNYSTQDEASNAVQATAREEVVKMERGIAILEVVITIAPLLGLLGTVSGLVSVFSTLGEGADGGADPSRIALGISEALNTTIGGLAVAVPTVIAHSYFTKKIERLAVRMEVLMTQLLQSIYAAPSAASFADSRIPMGAEPPPHDELR